MNQEQSDKAKKVCFKCYKQDNSCCKDIKLGITTTEEAFSIFENAQYPAGHDFRNRELYTGEQDNVFLYESPDDDYCMFFDKETADCKIYDKRPMICRTFPNVWQNPQINFIKLCPLAFIIPLADIKTWIDPYTDEIAKMPFYNGNKHNNGRYVNIRELLADVGLTQNFFEDLEVE